MKREKAKEKKKKNKKNKKTKKTKGKKIRQRAIDKANEDIEIYSTPTKKLKKI